MGVDYIGHYGIGIGVKNIDFDDECLDSEIASLECMSEFLEEKLDEEKYSWFKFGEGSYTWNDNDYFIEIKDPFKKGSNNLDLQRDDLLKHLKEIGLTPNSDFGVIGELEVW